MKTAARCPTCDFPFSFWKLAAAPTLFNVYCKSCRWRIAIKWDKQIMWAEGAVFILITFVLISFVLPDKWLRLLLLGVLWFGSFAMLEIIVALMIVNWGQFSRPEETDSGA
jgi:hypothetical protein